MKDFSQLAKYHTSPAANLRIKKRRRAQLRLKFYGIFAIALSALALVSLLWTVLGNAAGGVREHYITLPVALPADKIDVDNIKGADFGGLTKAALRDYFPAVIDRKEKRALYDVLSVGASYELRESVQENPDLIGTQRNSRLLASDVSDLYLKGEYGTLELRIGDMPLTIIAQDKKQITFEVAPAVFKALHPLIKRELERRAGRLEGQALQEQNGVRVFKQRMAAANDALERDNMAKQVQARQAKMDALLAEAATLRALVTQEGFVGRLDKFMPSVFIKIDSGWAKLREITDTGAQAKIITPVDESGVVPAQDWSIAVNIMPEVSRKISDSQMIWLETLRSDDRISSNFNWRFLSSGDSREPELAGVWGAIVGSTLTMLVTFLLAFPIGVLSAIYLEEFAPRNRLTDFVEVNINNLAAVPSIVFGLLGLAVFLGVFGVPRSTPLAGGIVLALMSLPTIIIASRAAIRAVPPSIRDAAIGLGASKLQTSFHHVLPLAMPGILTGSIIAMAQALGETAPLIMIGMVAFIVDIPSGITDSASALPVQVFRWADLPERAFEARTAAAICVLLVFLVLMNALAVVLRKRFERRW